MTVMVCSADSIMCLQCNELVTSNSVFRSFSFRKKRQWSHFTYIFQRENIGKVEELCDRWKSERIYMKIFEQMTK